MTAPEWKTGNDPEYSRADLHELDAIMCGGSENAAKRPALVDLMAFAAAQREALKYSLTALCMIERTTILPHNARRDVLIAIDGCRAALGIRSTPADALEDK